MVSECPNPVSRSLCAALAAALALLAALLLPGPRGTGAQVRVHLPLALRSGSAPPAPTGGPPITPLPVDAWSTVLTETPVYAGMGLSFFELRLETDPPSAVALYDPPAAIPGRDAVTTWYRAVLSAHGWRLATAGAAGGRWTRPGGGWIDVHYGVGADGVLRLELRRDPDGVAPPGDGSLVLPDLALPAGAVRLRYDRADLLPEEFGFALTAAEARLAVERALGRDGWRETSVQASEVATLLRFRRGEEAALVSVRPVGLEASEVGLGATDCEPLSLAGPVEPPSGQSVYLSDVSAPADMRLVGYERDALAGTAAERWLGTCSDLDLVLAGHLGRLRGAGWRLSLGAPDRRPGGASLQLGLPTGLPLSVEFRTVPDGAAEAMIRRPEAARRLPTARASLLWPDVPLPPGSDAWQLTTETADGWQWRERYRVPAAMAGSLASWYRSEMMESSWRFDRLDPADLGPGQVYYRDGEELWVQPRPGPAPEVSLARRRTCAGAEPVAPPALGQPARWLAELLVYPGAELEDFAVPAERYRTRCAATALIADWYRTMLERGNWALVSTLHPNDPSQRLLTFARPWERTWPPEQRTAWAEVEIERLWPYHHRIVLRRDPTGILPGAGAP